jgi:pimeloyl-ACP methyl ester carboxylesterase
MARARGSDREPAVVDTHALPPAVTGETLELDDRAGRLRVQVAGAGEPVLLLHSVNAAASAAEVAPLHEHLRDRYRVWTPDLPGFGRSERSDRDYAVRLYVDAVHDVVDAIARTHGDAPIRALGLSTSSEFLARAVTERPERFRSLVLVTPTGFDRRGSTRRGPPGSTREVSWLYRFLRRPAVGRFLFRQLTRPGTIRYFLRRTFGRRDVDDDLWRYGCRSARQPGARHAPVAFLSGRLFSGDIRTVYGRLSSLDPPIPVWVPHATRGDFADFTGADWARTLPHWKVEPWPTGALPWFEAPTDFLRALDRFLAGERAA